MVVDKAGRAVHSQNMALKLRLQYPGAIYHLMSRGDRLKRIFLDDADRQLFLSTLTETCAKTDWQIHAYCLMNNHFHLIVETPKGNLVAGMKWLLGTYTSRFNRQTTNFWANLFSGRYKSLFGGQQRQRLSQDCLRLCSSKPGASQAFAARSKACGIFLEQLCRIFAPAQPTCPLAAGGSAVGRNGPSPPTSTAGRKGICPAHGSLSSGGSCGRISKNPARLVLWGGCVSE